MIRNLYSLLIVIGISLFIFLTMGGCDKIVQKKAVLIVQMVDANSSDKDVLSFSDDVVKKAIKHGGQICVTTDQLERVFPEWELYGAMSTDGKHYTQGTFINFLASQGWTFQSNTWGALVFVKDVGFQIR